jgi:hypothetical protein
MEISNYYNNGIDLIKYLKKHELPYAILEGNEKIAGVYQGIDPLRLYQRLAYGLDKNEKGKITILGCFCGEETCWPMKIRTIDSGEKIIWKDFEQPYRNSNCEDFWDYSKFGDFTFDKKEYNKALNELRSEL